MDKNDYIVYEESVCSRSSCSCTILMWIMSKIAILSLATRTEDDVSPSVVFVSCVELAICEDVSENSSTWFQGF